VQVVLDAAGHAFKPGHRLRLAISPTYWPFAWPSPEIARLAIATGETSSLELPVRPPRAADALLPAFDVAEHAAPLDADDRSTRSRMLVRDLARGVWRTELEGSEWTTLRASGFSFGERGTQTFSIIEGDPLSARIDRVYRHELHRGDWHIATETRTSLSATTTDFIVETNLEVFEGDSCVHRLSGTTAIPRDGA
jgi:hypothetical protein